MKITTLKMEEIVASNLATLKGEGSLGQDFKTVLSSATVKEGALTVSCTIVSDTGAIIKFPKLRALQNVEKLPVLISFESVNVVATKQITFYISPRTGRILSYTSNDFLYAEAMEVILKTINAFNQVVMPKAA